MAGMDVFGSEERKEVMDVLESSCMFRYNHEHLRQGHWKAKSLEEETQKFTGAKYAHAVSSGSAAVATMLAASGIGHGDHVIVPPFTFLAPIEAVLLAGGLPIFAEIDESLCISASGIENAVTPKTKAVLLVHMCGAADSMDEIVAVCQKHNLILLEDAGQAMGAFYKGTSVGLFGKAGAFSFDFFKIATMGEGGMLITDDHNIYNNIEQFSDHGHNHIGNNRGMEPHPILGINYRISELHAAVGLAQMRKIEHIRNAKRNAKTYLKNLLKDVEGISFRKIEDPEGDSATFLNFFTEDAQKAQKLINAFLESGLSGFSYWFTNMYHFINQWDHLKALKSPAKMAIHHLGAPQDYNNLKLPYSQDIIGRLVSLSIKTCWEKDELQYFGKKMVQVAKNTL